MVAALPLLPQPGPSYRAQFLDKVDCWHDATGGNYRIGEAVRPRFESPEAGPDGIFACGWMTLEDGAWSLGRGAHLYFRLPADRVPSALHLHLRGRVLVGRGLPEQRIELFASGMELPPLRLDNDHVADIGIDIPLEAAATGTLDIRFHFPDAASPRALGIGSYRGALALYLEAVTLTTK